MDAGSSIQPETDRSLCLEKFPPTLLLWPWDRVPPYCFGLGRDLGLRAEGLVSGSCSLKSKISSEFLGAPFSSSADAHTFSVTVELVSTWVLRQLESSPWQWHFCLSWLNSDIPFLLSILEAQLPLSISYLEGTHQCDISSWLVQKLRFFSVSLESGASKVPSLLNCCLCHGLLLWLYFNYCIKNIQIAVSSLSSGLHSAVLNILRSLLRE